MLCCYCLGKYTATKANEKSNLYSVPSRSIANTPLYLSSNTSLRLSPKQVTPNNFTISRRVAVPEKKQECVVPVIRAPVTNNKSPPPKYGLDESEDYSYADKHLQCSTAKQSWDDSIFSFLQSSECMSHRRDMGKHRPVEDTAHTLNTSITETFHRYKTSADLMVSVMNQRSPEPITIEDQDQDQDQEAPRPHQDEEERLLCREKQSLTLSFERQKGNRMSEEEEEEEEEEDESEEVDISQLPTLPNEGFLSPRNLNQLAAGEKGEDAMFRMVMQRAAAVRGCEVRHTPAENRSVSSTFDVGGTLMGDLKQEQKSEGGETGFREDVEDSVSQSLLRQSQVIVDQELK